MVKVLINRAARSTTYRPGSLIRRPNPAMKSGGIAWR